MQLLVYMFLMITIFCIPLFYIYSNNKVKFLQFDSGYIFNKFSLGNMGGSTVVCKHEKIGVSKELDLSCPIGTELLQSSIIFGAMNQDLNQLNYC